MAYATPWTGLVAMPMEPSAIRSLFSVTEVELIYRNKVMPSERTHIKSATQAYDILLHAWDMNKICLVEECMLLLIDRNGACLGISKISSGGVSSCTVDPKIVFATSLMAKASGIILAHNHPSGNTEPSKADIALTSQLREGAKLLDIVFMDHLIVTPHECYSIMSEGLVL